MGGHAETLADANIGDLIAALAIKQGIHAPRA